MNFPTRLFTPKLFYLLGLLALGACGSGDTSTASIEPGFSTSSRFIGFVISIAPPDDGSGNLYAVGSFTTFNTNGVNGVARLKSDGSLDATFDTGSGFDGSVFSIALATDGSDDIYVLGAFSDYNGKTTNNLARLNSDGSLDAGFNTGSGFNNNVENIAVANDGSADIYVVGRFDEYNGKTTKGIARLNSDGSLDASFDIGSGFNNTVENIAAANDASGDVYVAGSFTSYNGAAINGFARVNSDGSLDPKLDPGSGFNGSIFSIVAATDGSGDVYIGGEFTAYNGTTTNRIARVNNDGSLDTEFDTGTGFNSFVGSIAAANDASGDLYTGGGFTVYNGANTQRIARINSDGSFDAGFDTGSGFDGSPFCIASATDASDDVYVGGQFSHYDSQIVGDIVRLKSWGALD